MLVTALYSTRHAFPELKSIKNLAPYFKIRPLLWMLWRRHCVICMKDGIVQCRIKAIRGPSRNEVESTLWKFSEKRFFQNVIQNIWQYNLQ